MNYWINVWLRIKNKYYEGILLINKQLVELLFIKRSSVINHQILQTTTQYINYKLSIDYKFELLLYNLDILMAPFTYEACL